MSEFVPIETRFEELGDSDCSCIVVTYTTADEINVWDEMDVGPGDAPRIVDWMAKRTAENVAWLEHREEIIAYLRGTVDVCRQYVCERPPGANPISNAERLLSAAVPEDNSECDRCGGTRVVRLDSGGKQIATWCAACADAVPEDKPEVPNADEA